MVSPKQYIPPSPKDDFDLMANSIFFNILAVSQWLQRFYPACVIPGARNPHTAKNLTERYPYF
jgi:hypothetical protein